MRTSNNKNVNSLMDILRIQITRLWKKETSESIKNKLTKEVNNQSINKQNLSKTWLRSDKNIS